MNFFQQVMDQYDQQSGEPQMAERGPGFDYKSGDWQKGKGMRPEFATALVGFGQGLGQLASGQTPNLAPTLAAIRAQRSGGGGGGSIGGGGGSLNAIMADPMKRAALMEIYKKNPALAERIMMGAMGFDLPQGWAAPPPQDPTEVLWQGATGGGAAPSARSQFPDQFPNVPYVMGQ